MKRTMAVPSFNKDSPSISVPSFLLAPNSFNNATTATGSVALAIAPNINAIVQPQPTSPIPALSKPITRAAVKTIAKIIPGIARMEALAKVLLNV